MRGLVILIVHLFAVILMGLAGASNASKNMLTDVLGLHPDAKSGQACWYTLCPTDRYLLNDSRRMVMLGTDLSAQVVFAPVLSWYGYPFRYTACFRLAGADWQTCIRPNLNDGRDRLEIDIMLEKTTVTVGDVIAELGSPRSMSVCASYVPTTNSHQEGIRVTLEFDSGILVRAYQVLPDGIQAAPTSAWQVRSGMRVATIEYHPIGALYSQPHTRTHDVRWMGFRQSNVTRAMCEA